jgi:hypothetical protein
VAFPATLYLHTQVAPTAPLDGRSITIASHGHETATFESYTHLTTIAAHLRLRVGGHGGDAALLHLAIALIDIS